MPILGVGIDTTQSGLEFEDVNEQPLTSSEFLDAISVGTLVDAAGELSGGSETWQSLEIEDD